MYLDTYPPSVTCVVLPLFHITHSLWHCFFCFNISLLWSLHDSFFFQLYSPRKLKRETRKVWLWKINKGSSIQICGIQTLYSQCTFFYKCRMRRRIGFKLPIMSWPHSMKEITPLFRWKRSSVAYPLSVGGDSNGPLGQYAEHYTMQNLVSVDIWPVWGKVTPDPFLLSPRSQSVLLAPSADPSPHSYSPNTSKCKEVFYSIGTCII